MINFRPVTWYLLSGYSLLATGLFYFVNLYLADAGLPDYDSVTNLEVANSIVDGRFGNLFYHASPTFNILLALLLKINSSFLILEKVNSLFILTGGFIICRFVANKSQLHWLEELLLFAITGSSLTLTWESRSLGLEGLSFLVFCVFFVLYYQSLSIVNRGRWYVAMLVYGLLLTINYKMLTLMPILLVIELYQFNRKHLIRKWMVGGGILGLVFIVYSTVGFLLGLPFLRYLYVAGSVILKSGVHPTINVPLFSTDLLFYFRYLFSFENPMLLIGFFGFPFTANLKAQPMSRKLNHELYICFFAFCIVLGMSLLQKAPRGITSAYPLLYVLTFLVLRKLIKKKVYRTILLCGMLAHNIQAIQQRIFQYTTTGYQELGAYLTENKIGKVAATASNRIIPFVPKSTEVKVVISNKDLRQLKSQGFKYLIIDKWYKLCRIDLDIQNVKIVKSYPDKIVLAPVLALECAEYSGMHFDEALRLSRSFNTNENQLFLVEL